MFRITRFVREGIVSLCLIATACTAPAASPVGPGADLTPPPSAPASSAPAASGSTEPTGAPSVGLDEVASLDLDLEGGPDWPMELDGSVWILAPDATEPFVYRIDPETGEEQARITVGGRLCQGMVAGFDALWVCANDGALRIDPVTNKVVANIGFTAARVFARLVVSEDAVWSLAGNVVPDTVVRIDPATNAVTATYPLGHVAGALSYGHGALWATSPADGLLLRIDPQNGAVTTAVSDLPAPISVATGAGSVWVVLYGPDGPAPSPGDPALLRYDPATGETTLLDIGSSPGGAADIVAADDAVWVRGSDPFIVRLDPANGEIVWAVSHRGMGDGSIGLSAGGLWATSVDRDSVWRVDP
jgi:streptogramin lyase